MDTKVAVVIPYFQREPGILARALPPIFRQRDVERPHVFVVDDESPVPAASELAGLSDELRASVTVIRQKNAGPGGARNTAFAALPPSIEWVALLDSDDTWIDNHLSIALRALNQGFDLFFSDHQRDGESITQFERCRFDLSGCRRLDPVEPVFAYEGDLFTPVLRHSPLGMSTTVMRRRSKLLDLRFITNMRHGDDLLYALDLVHATSRVAISAKSQVRYGKGVNISIFEWSTNESFHWTHCFSLFYSEIRKRFDLTPVQDEILKTKERSNRELFLQVLFGMLRRRRTLDLPMITRFLMKNPKTLLEAPLYVHRKLSGATIRKPEQA